MGCCRSNELPRPTLPGPNESDLYLHNRDDDDFAAIDATQIDVGIDNDALNQNDDDDDADSPSKVAMRVKANDGEGRPDSSTSKNERYEDNFPADAIKKQRKAGSRYEQDLFDAKANKRKTILSPLEIQNILQEGRKLVRGLYDYRGSEETSDLDFQKGDILEVVKKDGDWWKAKNLMTGDEGYIPMDYVAFENSLESFDWFHGDISRADAIKLLKFPTNQSGTFLIRESETKKGSYSLSILHEEPEKGRVVKHYRIKNLDQGGCYITEILKFDTLKAMVETYSKGEQQLCCVLSKPCTKLKPQRWDLSRATRDQWEIPREEIRLISELGSGNFGQVWKGIWNEKVDVAVKTLKENAMKPEKFLEEATTMKKLKHPKLITLFAVCTTEEPIYIITELMSQGSLKDFLVKNMDIKLENIIYIAVQIAEGMCYIEREKCIHRDLAARNILMGENYIAKIGDFGLARVIDEDLYVAKQGAKCPMKWTAPEAINYQRYTIHSDVWSYGIVLVELTTHGATPYQGLNNREVVEKLEKNYRHPQPSICPDNLYDVMLDCWNKTPAERPSFENLRKTLEEFPID